MSNLYQRPFHVYLILGLLALWGVISGLRLPVSLFPNSSKPVIQIQIPYGGYTGEDFLRLFGAPLESQLRRLNTSHLKVEEVIADYRRGNANFSVEFGWGIDSDVALREVRSAVHGIEARLPKESRDGIWVWVGSHNTGFFAMSVYSEKRTLDELYKLVEPILTPKLAKVVDADNPGLWNPSEKEIRIELIPEVLTQYQLFPKEIEQAISQGLQSQNAGDITVGDKQIPIQMPPQLSQLSNISELPIPTPSGKHVLLGEVATVDYGPSTAGNRAWRTNGTASLILFSRPKPGGNIKRMSEELSQAVRSILPLLPPDVKAKELVDPSVFIKNAVGNVFREVCIAAGLAVIILFLFIGSLRNVITAAIEIPLSMVLAFILMKWFGLNINLISLGGLALAAGMNVDGSVVVMENIFRHFENAPPFLDPKERLRILMNAVNEVKFPILASTIASLVVFLPLAFTSDLAYAILGDLALAVVFSHGFSAVVALILVPTVRLHLMSGSKKIEHPRSPIEKQITWLENRYASLLGKFISFPKVRLFTYAGLALLLAVLVVGVYPRLPREIVGKPDTDWLFMDVSTHGNSLIKQMELTLSETERKLMDKFGKEIDQTFSEANINSAWILLRLRDKHDMERMTKEIENFFPNTPTHSYHVGSWNPGELSIPDPPHLKIAIRGGSALHRAHVGQELVSDLRDKKLFDRYQNYPDVRRELGLNILPRSEQWTAQKLKFTPTDLSDLVRTATVGKPAGELKIDEKLIPIRMRFPQLSLSSPEEIESLPIYAGKLVPLKAFADVKLQELDPEIHRKDEKEVVFLTATENADNKHKKEAHLKEASTIVNQFQKRYPELSIGIETADKELVDALTQLTTAILLSIGLILLTLVIQFGSFVEPLLVLVAIPMGLIGVLLSLWIFGSTLSLNSALGIILLNGISVANSIILVDFIKRQVETGMLPRLAALSAAKQRMRPILITSLTTILGMLPVALGFGEGGKVLQPLGIAVAGGLWISMLITLFVVPALQVGYLEFKQRSREKKSSGGLLLLLQKRLGWTALLILIPSSLFGVEASFDSLLRTMVDRNIDLATQRSQLEATQAKNLSSHLSLLPTLSAQATHSLVGSSSLENRANRTAIGARADLNLFRFGGDIAAMSAASSEEKAANAQVKEKLLKAEADSSRLIFQWLQAMQEKEITVTIRDRRKEILEIAEKRYERGLLPLQEVEKFRIDLDNALARLADSEIALSNALTELSVQLGSAPSIPSEWPWKEKILKQEVPNYSPNELSNLRPDLMAARFQKDGIEERKSQLKTKFLPSLDLSFKYGYEIQGFRSQNPVGGNDWSAMATLSIPIFDRLENYGTYRAQVETLKQAELNLEKTSRSALIDVEQARNAFNTASRTVQLRDKNMIASEKIYQSQTVRFQKGLLSANDLALEQDRYIEAQLLAIKGWSTAHQARVRLIHSVGQSLLQ